MNDSNSQDNLLRLQLFLARAGVASRRASEQIIADGRVSVNGSVVTVPGTKVSLTDVVCLDGEQVHIQETKRYIMLNKPAGYVCSLADEKGRPIASDLLAPHFSERLYNVGRLDMFSSGIILFTNDGEFAAKISHPSSELEKEYVVESSLPIPDILVTKFEKGVRIDDVFYKCKSAEKLNSHRIRIVLIEGKNREIRKVFESFEIGIKGLVRVRLGNLHLGDKQAGQFRELSQNEIQELLSLCKRK